MFHSVKSSQLFVQLMHTNYYKIFTQLNSFKIIIVSPTVIILNDIKCLTILYWLVCLTGTNKGLVTFNMHGASMKILC